MGSLTAGLLDGLKGAYCAYINAQPDWYRNWIRLTSIEGLNDLADWMTRSICDRPPTDDDYPPPKVSGGQCPGVTYQVTCTVQMPAFNPPRCADVLTTITYNNVKGPITRFDRPYSGGTESGFTYTGGERVAISAPASAYEACPSTGLKSIVCVRVDGLPDECGNDEFEPEPFEPTPISIDIDVTYGPNNEFNLTVPVIIAPVYVAFDGTVNAPVTFEISPEISLEGTWTLFPDAKLDINFPSFPGKEPPGGTGDDDPPPDDPGEDDPNGGSEDDPDVPGKPDPEDPEEPEERIHFLICRAVVESDGRPSSLYQEIGPDLYVPRLGSARFGATIDGVTFWSSDIDIKGLNTIIECPIPFGATRFTVNASQGVSINYAPMSTDPQGWPNYLQIGRTYVSDAR